MRGGREKLKLLGRALQMRSQSQQKEPSRLLKSRECERAIRVGEGGGGGKVPPVKLLIRCL